MHLCLSACSACQEDAVYALNSESAIDVEMRLEGLSEMALLYLKTYLWR